MNKLSRLFNGELKKIFLGISIFFMTAILILSLTISPKLFNPTQKNDTTTEIVLNISKVEDVYSSFESYEAEINSSIFSLEDQYDDLINSSELDCKKELISISEVLFELRANLYSLTISDTDNINAMLNCYSQIVEKKDLYALTYKNYKETYVLPIILVDEKLDFNIEFELDLMSKILDKDGNRDSLEYYVELNDALMNYATISNLRNYTEKIENLVYSADDLSLILTQYKTLKDEYKNSLKTNMQDLLNEASIDDDVNISLSQINNMKDMALSYLSCQNNYLRVLENGLIDEITSNYGGQLSKYLGYENINDYQVKERLTRYSYLYKNDMSDQEFSNTFSFNCQSGSDTKLFDYMFFSMELSSIFIVAFVVIIGAGMIAKEFSEGTIKLLIMRPFSRNKIVLSKILATMFFAFVFVIVNSIVAFITGAILYGVSISNVMIVLNASTVFVIPIWVEFLIYLICLMIKFLIFALLSIAISTIFRSYITSVVVSFGIYLLNFIITFISKGANWLKYNVFANIDLFKYFGGSFNLNYVENQNLNNLFVSPVFSGTSIWSSIIIIGVLTLILNIVIFTVFNKRDIS